jgi:hypothetical protein
MGDVTEGIRREMFAEINAEPGSREALEVEHGEVWDLRKLESDFEILEFRAPFVTVRRRSDGTLGSMKFQHTPRFYFGFEPHRDS